MSRLSFRDAPRRPRRPAARRRTPAFEAFERRELLTGFLQGVAFVDADGNGRLDSGEARKEGATIELRSGDGQTLLQTRVTDANGYFLFDGVSGGTYRIVEQAPSGFENYGVEILSPWIPAPEVLGAGTIRVTLPDFSQLNNRLVSNGPNQVMRFRLNDDAFRARVGQMNIRLSTIDGSLQTNVTNIVPTYCVDLFNEVAVNDQFPIVTQPSGEALGPNAGRIAYLYNNVGRFGFATGQAGTIEAAGFHLALYELRYETSATLDVQAGDFRLTPSASDIDTPEELATFQAIVQAAADYILSSAGKLEEAVYLDGSAAGKQGMIIAGSYNFANTASPNNAALGDFVWEDVNGNGLQDAGEPGIGGVIVQLLDGNGAVVGDTVTDTDGLYLFPNLAPGTYTVQFVRPDGYVFTAPNQGNDAANDSDADSTGLTGTYTLASGQTIPTVDAGLYRPVSIGNYVWEDKNGDGIQNDGGPSAGIDGVALTLTGITGAGVAVMLTSTTAADGSYLFDDLAPGTYTVSVATPDGFVPTLTGEGTAATDSNGSSSGTTPAALPSGAGDLTLDFGFYRPVAVGDFVWNDANRNGIQDNGEAGINDVALTLTGTDGAGNNVTRTATTAANGGYLFGDLPPGTYTVAIDAANFAAGGALFGWVASPTLAGTDRAVDANPSGTGTTPSFLASDGKDLTLDFGYYLAAPGIRVVKLTNGTDNNTGTGPYLPVGSTVAWTYVVANTGNVPLANVSVTDDIAGVVPVYQGGDANSNGRLDLDETWTYTATGTAVAGPYVNVGTAAGTPVTPGGDAIPGVQGPTATDPDRYTGYVAGIAVEKYVRLVDAPAGGEGLTPGFWKTHSRYGPAPLAGWPQTGYDPDNSFEAIFGVDAPGTPTLLQALQAGGGGLYALNRHAAAALLNAAQPNIEYAFTAAQVIAKVQAAYADPGTIEAVKDQLAAENERGADLSTAGVGLPVSGPGSEADTAPGLVVQVGQQVIFTIIVTNPGTFPLGNVVVTDPDFTPAPVLVGGFNKGDTNQDGKLDPNEAWEYTAGPVVVSAGTHVNLATATGTPVLPGPGVSNSVIATDPAYWTGGAPQEAEARVSGFVYVDLDDDGEFDSDEVGIVGVKITLVGAGFDGLFGTADDTTEIAFTDDAGFYEFAGLAPGKYRVFQAQPAAYNDGKDTLGTGTTSEAIFANDAFQVTLVAGDNGINFNFGERPTTTGALRQGDTATIGYWHNKNGQALIKALGTTADGKTLGQWLAESFPALYGAQSSKDFTTWTNAQIALRFLDLFAIKGQKTDAQVLATALAVYATNSTLNSTAAGLAAAQAQGFNVSAGGTGSRTFNIGSHGTAVGLTDGISYSIFDLLVQANLRKKNNAFNANAFNAIFTAINEAGDR